MLAGAAAAAQSGVSQTAPPSTTATDEDLQSARDQMRTNAQQIAKVKLPMPTEPAFHFKA
jgi:hypothetical protein